MVSGHTLSTVNSMSFQPDLPQRTMDSPLIRAEVFALISLLLFFKWICMHCVLHSSAFHHWLPNGFYFFLILSSTSFFLLHNSSALASGSSFFLSHFLISHYNTSTCKSKKKPIIFVKFCKSSHKYNKIKPSLKL